MKQLASHTSGIGRPWDRRNKREFDEVTDHKSPSEALDIFANDLLKFEPGTDFKYTSSGYILLSAVIESAAQTKQLNIVHHGGVTSGASTAFILLIPEYKAAIAYATNTQPKEHWKMRELVGEILLQYIK